MKFKKLFLTGLLCLSITTAALADGETPGGNRSDNPPPEPTIVQIIVNFFTGG